MVTPCLLKNNQHIRELLRHWAMEFDYGALSTLCQFSLSTTLKGKEESPGLTVEEIKKHKK